MNVKVESELPSKTNDTVIDEMADEYEELLTD